PFITSRPW
nr:Chain B, ECM21 [Saccharomyces cerevisiae]